MLNKMERGISCQVWWYMGVGAGGSRTQGQPGLRKILSQKEKEDRVFSLKVRHTHPWKSVRRWGAEKAQWFGALAALAKT